MGAAIAALLVGPAAARGELAGSPGGELYGHAWVQAWAAEAWPAWPSGTASVLGAEAWPVIDPLPTWIAGGLARVVGPVGAWNAGMAAAVVLAAVGGGALARAVGGAGLVGAVGLALAPIVVGSWTSGLTEDGAVGLLALALAALWRGRVGRGGILLGALAWCGLYLAWMGALAAVVLGMRAAWAERRGAWARVVGRWTVGAALAAGIAAPAAAPFAARLGGLGHRFGAPPEQYEPLWRLNPWRKADLAAFVAPGRVDPGEALVREHPTYVGFATLGLAALGGGGPAWLGVGALGAVALGDRVSVAGTPWVANPVAPVFTALPLADRVNHRARLWVLGQLVLVALAARGARHWPRAGAALVAAELLALSPTRMPLPGTPAASPAIYAAIGALPPGPVVVDGASGPGVPPQKVLYDQRAHGRRLLHDPNRPGPVEPGPGTVLVALGDRVGPATARFGPPAVATADGAAWWIPPR